MSEKEIEELKNELLNVLGNPEGKQFEREDRNSDTFQKYALSTRTGKAVYESCSDEELLEYLRGLAEKLNHAPAQREMLWVLRDYVKKRFGKWPYALRKAGLSASAGRGGATIADMETARRRKEELLKELQRTAVRLGKIPHPRDLPEICEELKKEYSTWSQVVQAAGLDPQWLNAETVYPIDDLETEYLTMLETVKQRACELGRSPAHREIDPSIKEALSRRCGSWRNALYQIGLTPVVRIRPFNGIYIDYRKKENRTTHTEGLKDCVYQVLNLSEEETKDLELLRKSYLETGRIPAREQVDQELGKRLIVRCGSWINVLYQIGITPKEYQKSLAFSAQRAADQKP